MRAMETSCTTASVLFQRRVTPGAVLLVVLRLSAALPPASARSTVAILAASMQCAQGYSGCIGVGTRGGPSASRAGAGVLGAVAVADGGDRSPEEVVVLGFEYRDLRLVHRRGHRRVQSCIARHLAAGGG